jgi:hypothetical protein
VLVVPVSALVVLAACAVHVASTVATACANALSAAMRRRSVSERNFACDERLRVPCRRRPCLKRIHSVQMAAASARHIGNHRAWAERRAALVRSLCLRRTSSHSHACGRRSADDAVVVGALEELAKVEALHRPLLIGDVAARVGAGCPPFALSTLA